MGTKFDYDGNIMPDSGSGDFIFLIIAAAIIAFAIFAS